jgi:hypothetical protein
MNGLTTRTHSRSCSEAATAESHFGTVDADRDYEWTRTAGLAMLPHAEKRREQGARLLPLLLSNLYEYGHRSSATTPQDARARKRLAT